MTLRLKIIISENDLYYFKLLKIQNEKKYQNSKKISIRF